MHTISHPPHSIDAERSVLGGLMRDNALWPDVADTLKSSDFYRGKHGIIFDAMRRLVGAGEPLDLVTVTESLEERKALKRAGGREYVAEIADAASDATHTLFYARAVSRTALRRQIIRAAGRIRVAAEKADGAQGDDLLSLAEREIGAVAQQRGAGGDAEEIAPLVAAAMANISHLQEAGDGMAGLATGYADVDKMTSGFQRGDLIVIAGRPSMGKTSLAMNIVEHVLIHHDVPVPTIVFSLEMNARMITTRLLGSRARVDVQRMLAGSLTPEDSLQLETAAEEIRATPLRVVTKSSQTPAEVRSRVSRFAQENGGGDMLVVVDYMQLLSGGANFETRTLEVAHISRTLKAIAIEFDCPVIAVSQLSRALEQRANKRPTMADLRESGAIEQDADLILFVYRDEVYVTDSEHAGTAEIIIGKQRNGPVGMTRLAFVGQLTRFENLAGGGGRDYDDGPAV